MMFFKKKKQIKYKSDLINRLTILDERVNANGLYKVSAKLNQLMTTIDSEYTDISKENYENIKIIIVDMTNNNSKVYKEFLLNKCQKIGDILNHVNAEFSTSNLSKGTSFIDKEGFEDKLFGLKGIIDQLNGKIHELKQQMDVAVDNNDKTKWQLLKTDLLRTQLILDTKNKEYNAINDHLTNVTLSNVSKDVSGSMQSIELSDSLIDADEVAEQNSYISEASSEVANSNSKIVSSFVDNFGQDQQDDSFEQAVAERAMTKQAKQQALSNEEQQ